MTICAKFVGGEASTCTRGEACVCHDFIEGCDCENCKAHELSLFKSKTFNKERDHIGWWYQQGLASLKFSASYPFSIDQPIPEGYTLGKIYREAP